MVKAPTELLPNHFRLDIVNQEGRPLRYQLEVRQGENLISQQNNLAINSGAKAQVEIELGPDSGPAEALLFKDGESETYRRIQIK